jgi:hypothetical protein
VDTAVGFLSHPAANPANSSPAKYHRTRFIETSPQNREPAGAARARR